jgi:hypothetical protein
MPKNNIIFRFAVFDDIDKLMDAFKNHWHKNHILGHNKDYFHYIYDYKENIFNIVIAEEQSTKEILGYLCFVKTNLLDSCDLDLIYLKAVEDKGAYIGIKLILYLIKNVNHNIVFSIGVRPTILSFYEKLKFFVGKTDHYYRILDKNEYKIAKIVNKNILQITDSGWNINLINNFDDFESKVDVSLFKKSRPYKDLNYFRHRYFSYPIYKYMIYSIYKETEKNIPAFLICREVKMFESKIIRIVDFIGEEMYFSYIASSLQKLLDINNYEFIDCYCCGMSENTMNKAGLIKLTDSDPNIIPNLFQPYVCKNHDLYYFTSNKESFRLFRGDSNQDQPRLYKN